MKEQVSKPVAAKLRRLALLARELRAGEHFQITRLTMLKGWCEDPVAAGRFALHLADSSKGGATKKYKPLIANALRQLKRHLATGEGQADEALWQALRELEDSQDEYRDTLGTREDHPLPGSPPGGACSPLRNTSTGIGTLELSGSAAVRRAVQPPIRNASHPGIRLCCRGHRSLLGSRALR